MPDILDTMRGEAYDGELRDWAHAQYRQLFKTGALPMWVVYRSPSDFSGHYVARLFAGSQPTQKAVIAPTLEIVRQVVAGGLICICRHESDDPVIVETWL